MALVVWYSMGSIMKGTKAQRWETELRRVFLAQRSGGCELWVEKQKVGWFFFPFSFLVPSTEPDLVQRIFVHSCILSWDNDFSLFLIFFFLLLLKGRIAFLGKCCLNFFF